LPSLPPAGEIPADPYPRNAKPVGQCLVRKSHPFSTQRHWMARLQFLPS